MLAYTIIPFAFFTKTRIETLSEKIAWIFTYFLPIGIFYFILVGYNASTLALFTIDITAINYVYENGYIQNDVLTIKKESSPTLRLSKKDIQSIHNNYYRILAVRFLILTILAAAHFFIAQSAASISNLYSFYIVLILLQAIFYLYNINRSLINLFLIIPMNELRFWGILFSWVAYSNLITLAICTVIAYPLLKFLEFTRMKRFKLVHMQKFIGDIDPFRIKYYLVASIVFIGIHFYNPTNISDTTTIVLLYYLAYRFLTWLVAAVMKRNNVKSNRRISI